MKPVNEHTIHEVPFPAGQIVVTRRIADELNSLAIGHLLSRHLHCDWGDLCEEDWKLNDVAVRHGERLLSSYKAAGQTVFIITEWDRSATTVLFADEY
ncbi:MAG: hypothetical protein KH295_01955 [Clostridiaceae bacterium]|nr:hypothetical protein [Clostridiaceae bacterium]